MLSKVTKINFLLKIAIDNQEKGYEKGKYFDLLSKFLNQNFLWWNVWRLVWRIGMWILGLKGWNKRFLLFCLKWGCLLEVVLTVPVGVVLNVLYGEVPPCGPTPNPHLYRVWARIWSLGDNLSPWLKFGGHFF